MKTILPLFSFVLLSCSGGPAVETPPTVEPTDLVITGLVHAGPGSGWEEAAVLVDGARIRGVVPTTEVPDYTGPQTAFLEAARVTAGFVDAHAHPGKLGARLGGLDLTTATSYAETLERVRTAAAGTPEGWLRGHGWDHTDWPDAPAGGWPLAADLEEVAPGRPVALSRIDGHAVWVSTAGLRAAGVEASTPDPEGGRILRGRGGAPSGVLLDDAIALLDLPAPTVEQQQRRLELGLGRLASLGITGVHAMGVGDTESEAYLALASRDALPIRVWVYPNATSTTAARLLAGELPRSEWLVFQGVKTYADGSLGSRGAHLLEDYSDDPGNVGLEVATREEIRREMDRCLGAGAQLAIHAIGDAAVRDTIDAVAASHLSNPGQGGARTRLEHAQVIHPDDVARLAQYRLVASMQPIHVASDREWFDDRLGPERLGRAYAWKSLAEAGVILAFGSDAPFDDEDPSLGLWAATTRVDHDGSTDQRLSLEEAVDAYTWGAAYAVYAERDLGVIERGRRADLSLWREEVGESGLRLHPVATIVGGQVVWREG